MIVIKNMEIPSSCYECRFAKNKKTNDYGSFCECGILEDYETINLLEHSKHPNCPLIEQEPRKGHWDIKDKMWWVCSACGCQTRMMKKYNVPNFCPACGAEMSEVEE